MDMDDPLGGLDASVTAETRISDDIEQSLWDDLLRPWLPACVSPSGGFHQEFARDWTPTDPGSRFLVFQSRMTWVAATMAETDDPGAEGYGDYTRHGVRFLAGVLFDAESDAFQWMVDAYPSERKDPLSTHWEDMVRRFDGKKILALAEFPGAPDVERAWRFGVRWSFFVSWTGSVGPRSTAPDVLLRVYNSESVITRDELPRRFADLK